MRSLQPIWFLILVIFISACSEPSDNTEKPPPSSDNAFVVPEMPDLLDYAATDVPTEPFRFEYQFRSDQLAFMIKANQLNERVISDITFSDGSSFPVELYVNQYRVLVDDLIQSSEAGASPTGSHSSRSDGIVVQSVAKTHRLANSSIPLSQSFIDWVANHLQTEANRQHFKSAVEVLK